MNLLTLLKSLAAGFVPLLAYIAADLVFGETIGLFVGIGIGIIEFLIAFLREKKADLFVAADTLLLSAMGALSLFLRNQLFFRLKPALMEGVLAFAMVLLLLLPADTLKAYMSHQVKGLVLDDRGMPAVRRSLFMIVAVLFLHTGLTVWAALAASTALWGFVSGGLLYLLLGAALVAQWLAARRKAKNSRGDTEARLPSPWTLLVFDESGRIYAEKVSASIPSPECWDSPIKGSARSKEEMEASLGRALERLGVRLPGFGGSKVPLTIQPAFALDSSGRINTSPFEEGAVSMAGSFAALDPGFVFVFVATIPLSAFPKGVDPTSRRFWPLSDLEALRSLGRLSPGFAPIVSALASLRHPLRSLDGASIVNTTHDASV